MFDKKNSTKAPSPLTPAFRSGDPYAPQLLYMCRCFLPWVPHLPACTKQIHMYGYMDKCACLLLFFRFFLTRSFKNCLPIVEAYSNSVVRSGETARWGTPHVEAYICAARSSEIYSWVVRTSDGQCQSRRKVQSQHPPTPVFWIRIHIILVKWLRIRIHIKVISWLRNRIRIRINLQMTSKMYGIWAYFSTFSWIWAFIWKLGSEFGSASGRKVGSGSV